MIDLSRGLNIGNFAVTIQPANGNGEAAARIDRLTINDIFADDSGRHIQTAGLLGIT
jgi:hypothetical protein